MILYSFFNFCILIRAWFRQLEDEFQELNKIKEDGEIRQKIKTIHDNHQKILEAFSCLNEGFGHIINVNFVTGIFFIGMTLISILNSDWFGLAATIPYVLFDAWVCCYGSQMIVTQVWKNQ